MSIEEVLSQLGLNDEFQLEFNTGAAKVTGIHPKVDDSLKIHENKVPMFDFSKSYKIVLDENNKVAEFIINVDPETNEGISITGKDLPMIFYQYMSAKRMLSDANKATVTDFPSTRK